MRELIRTLLIFLVLTLMTGLAYPLAVTGLSRLFFPGKAAGSLVRIADVWSGPPHRTKVHRRPVLPRPAVAKRL